MLKVYSPYVEDLFLHLKQDSDNIIIEIIDINGSTYDVIGYFSPVDGFVYDSNIPAWVLERVGFSPEAYKILSNGICNLKVSEKNM